MVNRSRQESYDVYIGRPMIWGNKFSHDPRSHAEVIVPTRELAIIRHEDWLLDQPHLLERLPDLAGKRLGCWCTPKSCHGHTLRRLVIFTATNGLIVGRCDRCRGPVGEDQTRRLTGGDLLCPDCLAGHPPASQYAAALVRAGVECDEGEWP
ncbi:MAG: DUF4326 domain-containing protein [Planctomycetaceae bacterium]